MTAPKNPPKIEVKHREFEHMESVLGLDPDTIDDTLQYRWVNRSAVKVARAKYKGYKLVTLDSGVTPQIEVDRQADGTIVAGDLVLMATDKKRFNDRKASEVDLAIERTKRAGDDVLAKGKKLGIKTRLIDNDEDEED